MRIKVGECMIPHLLCLQPHSSSGTPIEFRAVVFTQTKKVPGQFCPTRTMAG
jgi:hypothetical protein